MPGPFGNNGLALTGTSSNLNWLGRAPTETEVRVEAVCIVETKARWSDAWQPRPELVSARAEKHVASVGGANAALWREYGPKVKDPTDGSFARRDRLNLSGHFVALSLLLNGNKQPIWAGKVYSTTDEIWGVPNPTHSNPSHDDAQPRGMQAYHADGPNRILERIDISRSVWNYATGDTLDWVPSFNLRREFGNINGNRSAHQFTLGFETLPSFVFGGDEVWTHRQACDYILNRFVNGSDRPRFTMGGPGLAILDNLRSAIEIDEKTNAWDVLRKLIPTEFGVDFVLVETIDANQQVTGWEVRVFSLLSSEIEFAGFVFPGGPATVYDAVTQKETDVTLEESHAQVYDTIRVEGERNVTCFSLSGEAFGNGTRIYYRGWTAAQESDYKTAITATDTLTGAAADVNDAYRATDPLRNVFQRLQIDPAVFDLGDANWTLTGNGDTVLLAPPSQIKELRTLPWIPLREGFDYSAEQYALHVADPATNPYPKNNNPGGYIPDLRPPLFVCRGPTVSESGRTFDDWITVDVPPKDVHATSVAALENTIGIQLRSSPNHLFARNHWSGANPSNFVPGAAGVNSYDYQTGMILLAMQTDQRIAMEVTLPTNGNPARRNDGSTKVIRVADAHFWTLARGFIGARQRLNAGEAVSELVRSPNNTTHTLPNGQQISVPGFILRYDADKLLRVMAGAIGRYQRERRLCSIRERRLSTADQMLGRFLDAVQAGPSSILLQAPVTSVAWDFETGTTTIRAGHATQDG